MKKIYKIKNRTVYLPHIRASAVVQASFSFLFLNQISAAGGGGGGGGGGAIESSKSPRVGLRFVPRDLSRSLLFRKIQMAD